MFFGARVPIARHTARSNHWLVAQGSNDRLAATTHATTRPVIGFVVMHDAH